MLNRSRRPLQILRQPVRRQSTDTSPPPPRGSFLSASTIYPFILLSTITSLALNLSHQRTAKNQEVSTLKAQVTVLESLLERLRTSKTSSLSTPEEEEEDIERELELVGLGRGKGKQSVSAESTTSSSRSEKTSWSEVFLGKKGKEYQVEQDDTDWDKVFREADEAEIAKSSQKSTTTTSPPPAPSSRPHVDPTLPVQPVTVSNPSIDRGKPLPPSTPSKPAVYL